MMLNYGLSLEGDLYAPALSSLLEAHRAPLQRCFQSHAAGPTSARVRWTLSDGAIFSPPAGAGGALGSCLERVVAGASFDGMGTGTATLDMDWTQAN